MVASCDCQEQAIVFLYNPELKDLELREVELRNWTTACLKGSTLSHLYRYWQK